MGWEATGIIYTVVSQLVFSSPTSITWATLDDDWQMTAWPLDLLVPCVQTFEAELNTVPVDAML